MDNETRSELNELMTETNQVLDDCMRRDIDIVAVLRQSVTDHDARIANDTGKLTRG